VTFHNLGVRRDCHCGERAPLPLVEGRTETVKPAEIQSRSNEDRLKKQICLRSSQNLNGNGLSAIRGKEASGVAARGKSEGVSRSPVRDLVEGKVSLSENTKGRDPEKAGWAAKSRKTLGGGRT